MTFGGSQAGKGATRTPLGNNPRQLLATKLARGATQTPLGAIARLWVAARPVKRATRMPFGTTPGRVVAARPVKGGYSDIPGSECQVAWGRPRELTGRSWGPWRRRAAWPRGLPGHLGRPASGTCVGRRHILAVSWEARYVGLKPGGRRILAAHWETPHISRKFGGAVY